MIFALSFTVDVVCDVPSCSAGAAAKVPTDERDAATAQGRALATLTAQGWRLNADAGRGGVLDLCPACAKAGA